MPTGPAAPARRVDTARHHALAAALACAVGVAAFVLLPVYVRQSTGPAGTTVTRESALAVNGARVLLLGLAPIVVAALPALLPRRVRAVACVLAAVLLTAFVALGAMSVGLFVLPAALLMWLAAYAAVRERGR